MILLQLPTINKKQICDYHLQKALQLAIIKQLLLGYTITKHVSCVGIFIIIEWMTWELFAGMKLDLLLQKEKEPGLERQTIWGGYK